MANSGHGLISSNPRVQAQRIARSPVFKKILIALAVCAAYILAGKLSLRLASVHPSATPVWPPTGIAIAALLMLGSDFWPAVFVGVFVVNVTTAGSVLTSLGIAAGNTLEAVVACYLVTRFANGRRVFERSWDILRFALYAGILSTAVAATIGVTSLTLGGFASWNKYGIIWRTWWLGDATGALLFTPFLLLWGENRSLKWTKRQFVEAGVVLALLLTTAGIIFGAFFRTRMSGDPWTFLCTPVLVWTAFRFGQRESSAAICLLSVMAVIGTVEGRGPFVRETPNDSLLLLQCFLGVMALMTLMFGAEVSERRRQEEHARVLAVSDPLTGLANYRLLTDRLASEIKRYTRDSRPFSVLLLDQGAKKCNDTGVSTCSRLPYCKAC